MRWSKMRWSKMLDILLNKDFYSKIINTIVLVMLTIIMINSILPVYGFNPNNLDDYQTQLVSMNFVFTKTLINPGEITQGDASYTYGYCYLPFPVRSVFEVDVDPDTTKPIIVYRYGVPNNYNFIGPTSSIDLLDNFGYSRGWKFEYVWYTFCDDDYKEIKFNVTAYNIGKYMGAGGDPQGPSFVENYDYDSFRVS